MAALATFRNGFVALALTIVVALPLLSFDFGITEDEQLHNHHGHSILDYFLGRSDAATRSPLDGQGAVEFDYDPEARDLSGALNIYGGTFDLLCAATHRYLSPLGEYENRHVVNALFGGLLIVFTGLLAAHLAGWRAGLLALLMMALSPRIVAHSMNNPVDAPFAALYTFSLYYMLRFVETLPRPPKSVWIPLVIGIPLATDVRIAGLVLICYLGLFAGVRCLRRLRQGASRDEILRSLGRTALLGILGYLLVSLLWPLAHRNPLTTPLLAFRHLTRLETFDALDLFEGRWIHQWEIPWYFAPKWFLIGTPLFVPLGLVAAVSLFRRVRDVGGPATRRGDVWMVAFAALFPIAFVILRNSNVYNDARHLLFAYPPLIALGAVGLDHLLRLARPPLVKVAVALLIAATLVEPLAFMVRNHPHQGVYFSPLIGGVRGAWARYETDFWGNSVREGVEWIAANAEPRDGRPLRVRLWYGDQAKARYYIDRYPQLEHVLVEGLSDGWDYQILPTVECKYFPQVLRFWPPAGTVYEMQADGTPLGAVVMNPLMAKPAELLEGVEAWVERNPTHVNHAALALLLRQQGDEPRMVEALATAAKLPASPVGWPHETYIAWSQLLYGHERWEASIAASRHALRVNPHSAAAYYNACAAQLKLEQWEAAQHSCERSLELKFDNEAARINLGYAIERIGRN